MILKWRRRTDDGTLFVTSKVSELQWQLSPNEVVTEAWAQFESHVVPVREPRSIIRAEVWPETGTLMLFFARQPYVDASYRAAIHVDFQHLKKAWDRFERTVPDSPELEAIVVNLSGELARAFDRGRRARGALGDEKFECWHTDDSKMQLW